MKPIRISIQQEQTGGQIKRLLREQGYTVKDVQQAMGFENPQAVYKWIAGKSLPSLDNFMILSRMLHTSIEDILVIDGDLVRIGKSMKNCYRKNSVLFYRKRYVGKNRTA